MNNHLLSLFVYMKPDTELISDRVAGYLHQDREAI